MRLLQTLFLFLCVPFITGCGGGTSGSGLKSFDGMLVNRSGAALGGVLITIETTGDSAVTDADGHFVIISDVYGDEVTFLIESDEIRRKFSLKDVPQDSSRYTVDVTLDTGSDFIKVSNIRVNARFAGLCDYYFENREIIRQSNRVPEGTVCSLNVDVLSDGRRLENIPVILQYARCEPNSRWNTILVTKTGERERAGSAEVNFVYVDSPEFCRYRVVSPSDSEPFASYPIDTFSEQEFFSK